MTDQKRNESGMSLVETLVAMLLVALVLLSVAQLFSVGVVVNKAADDITLVSSLASEKVSELKELPYDAIATGGSLNTDVAGFFDEPDVEGDGTADYTRRWTVTDLATRKSIEVRVIATILTTGDVKQTTLGVLVADR